MRTRQERAFLPLARALGYVFQWAVRPCIFTAFFLLLLADTHPSQGIDDVPLRRQVENLLEELGSRQLSVRRIAERNLLKMGEEVLPLLPAPEVLKSVQVKQAVRRIRVTIEHRLAMESIKASHVTVNRKASLFEIAKSVLHQTDNELVVPKSLKNLRINPQWMNSPFWPAVDKLREQGIRTRFNATTGLFELSPSSKINNTTKNTAIWYQDAFQCELRPIVIKQFGDSLLANCEMHLASEPRLRPLLLRYNSADWSMTDDRNTGLRNFNPTAKYEIPLGQAGRVAKLQFGFLGNADQLTDKSDAKRRTLNLLGRASLLTAAREQPISFSRLEEEGVVRRRAGVSVNLRSVKEHERDNQRIIRVEIQVSYDIGKNAFESHQTWIFHNRVFLAAKKSSSENDQKARDTRQEFPLNDGFETLFHQDGTVGVVYRFKGIKQPLNELTFTYMAPTLLIKVPLDIQFKNIPLSHLVTE